MSLRFILIALIVCGGIFLLHLSLWIYFIAIGESFSGSIPLMTMVSGFTTAFYGFYYKMKKYNNNNKLQR